MAAPISPGQAVALVTQALGGRVCIPLSVVRGQLAALGDKVAIQVAALDPGLGLSGSANALGAPIRFSACLLAEGIHVEGESRTVTIRITEVDLATDDDAPGPLADAIRNGMIDTNNPATLMGNMMPLPPMITRAEGQEVVIDLMKVPQIERDERVRAAFATATSYLCIRAIDFEQDAIVLRLGLLPGGAKEAALSTARAALTPVVRYLWPEGRP
jgi:hypothetical protein